MDVPSFTFIGFAALVALVLARSSAPTWRRGVLAIANLLFLLSFSRDPRMLAPIAVFALAGYGAIKVLEWRRSRAAFAGFVVAYVSAFCVLKQYAFLPHGVFLPFAFLAVGISYLFFRILHLMIDTYQDSVGEPIPPLAFFNYAFNFTSFVAGPIGFYRPFLIEETVRPAPLDVAIAGRACERIVLGFGKVVVFAPVFGAVQERALAAMPASDAGHRILLATLVLGAYPLFLYLNFAGYMDVVIGVARFLRFQLPENFDAPFSARGFIDFWSRWHMTLSNWLKTYVYSPLFAAGIRRFPGRRAELVLGVGAFFVTFFLVGLWHGSTNMFVVYGLLQGLGVSVNKAYQLAMQQRLGRKPYRALTERPLYRAASRALTFCYFAVTLLWFAFSADGLRTFAAQTGVAGATAALGLTFVGAAIAIEASIAVGTRASGAWRNFENAVAAYVLRVGWSTSLLVAVVTVMVVMNDPTPRIVYKAF